MNEMYVRVSVREMLEIDRLVSSCPDAASEGTLDIVSDTIREAGLDYLDYADLLDDREMPALAKVLFDVAFYTQAHPLITLSNAKWVISVALIYNQDAGEILRKQDERRNNRPWNQEMVFTFSTLCQWYSAKTLKAMSGDFSTLSMRGM